MKKLLFSVVMIFIGLTSYAFNGLYQIIESSASNNAVGKYMYLGLQGDKILAGLFDEIYLLKKDDRISQTRIQTKTDYLTLRYNNENLHFFKNGNKYQPFNSNYSIQIEWQAQQTLGKLLGRGRRATCFLRYKEKLVCRFVIEEKEDPPTYNVAEFSDFLSSSNSPYPFKTYYTQISAKYDIKPVQYTGWRAYIPKSKSIIVAVDVESKMAYVVGISNPTDAPQGSVIAWDYYYALGSPVYIPISNLSQTFKLVRNVQDASRELCLEEYAFSLSSELFNTVPQEAIYWWIDSNYRIQTNFKIKQM